MSARARCRATALLVAACLAGCSLSDDEYRTIDAWLLCDECRQGERAAVAAIGQKAVHTLDEALVGPTPGRIANMVAQFRQTYRAIPPPRPVPEDAYVASLRANYIALYQRRAAVSLADIGGDGAIRALRRASDSAGPRGYREDVVRVVEAALAAAEADSFTGVIRPARPSFGDTVRVIGTTLWDGDEGVVLHGAPFPDSLFVQRWGRDSLAFIAAGLPGSYTLAVTSVGAGNATQATPLTIVTVRYAARTPATALLIPAAALPRTHYLVLPTRGGDTTDVFRLETPAERRVSTVAAVRGAPAPVLRWLACASVAPATLGPVSPLRGIVRDAQGRPVAGALVRIAAGASGALTDSAGRFSLPIPSMGEVDLRITRPGFRVLQTRVQSGADSIVAFLDGMSAGASTVTRSIGYSVRLPAGSCRLLQVRVSSAGGPRVIKLAFTSP